jgi:hypothetical protein
MRGAAPITINISAESKNRLGRSTNPSKGQNGTKVFLWDAIETPPSRVDYELPKILFPDSVTGFNIIGMVCQGKIFSFSANFSEIFAFYYSSTCNNSFIYNGNGAKDRRSKISLRFNYLIVWKMEVDEEF